MTTFRFPVPPVQAFTRPTWQAAWTPQPHIHLERAAFGIGDAIGRARARREYGKMMRYNASTLATDTPLDTDKEFIKFEWSPNLGPNDPQNQPPQTWYGVILGTDDAMEGNKPVDSGYEILRCMSLEWCLTRVQIDNAVVTDFTQTSSGTQIKRAVGFNLGDGDDSGPDEPRFNRAKLKPGSHYHFTNDLDNADPWNVQNMLEYLLQVHNPFGATGIQLQVLPATNGVMSWFHPAVRTEGRTLFDVLNQILDRRRGYTWSLGVDRNGDSTDPKWQETDNVYLIIYSYADQDITDAQMNVLLPASRQQKPLNNIDFPDPQQQIIRKDIQQRYGQIRGIGARRGAIFTMGVANENMEADWSAADKTRHDDGDPDATEANFSDLSDRQTLHDAWRLNEENRHVYTRFRIPANWDGKAGGQLTCPLLDASGNPTTFNVPFWWAGLRFSNRLPLREGWDYTNPASPVPSTSGQTALRKCFCTYTDGTTVATSEQLRSHTDEEIRKWNMGARVFADSRKPAMWSYPTGRPHQQALSHYNPANDKKGDPDYVPIFNWQNLKFTVYADWDEYVQEIYPAANEGKLGMEEVLVLRLGKEFRLDWLTAGTILDVKNGSQEVAAQSGGFIRDDRPQMQNILRVAWSYYSRPRVSVSIQSALVDDRLAILETGSAANHFVRLVTGALLTNLDGRTINSLVSSVAYDFSDGTTEINTDFARIDARRLV